MRLDTYDANKVIEVIYVKEYAYKKLIEAIQNNEVELYYKTDKKYLVADYEERGVRFLIDYYAMASATNQLLEEHPEYRNSIKAGIMNTLLASTIGGVHTIIEMTAYQLRYDGKNLGFLDEEILSELKNQIAIHNDEFTNNPKYNYEELDELAYLSSGRHFM